MNNQASVCIFLLNAMMVLNYKSELDNVWFGLFKGKRQKPGRILLFLWCVQYLQSAVSWQIELLPSPNEIWYIELKVLEVLSCAGRLSRFSKST